MKKTQKLLSGALAAAMFASSFVGVASAAETLPRMAANKIRTDYADRIKTNTSPDDIFSIEGQKFIMLDDMSDGTYFVMGYGVYGNAPFDTDVPNGEAIKPQQKYDIEDETNIGYYVENVVWNGNTHEGFLKLPESIKSHAVETTWMTEAGSTAGTAAEQYEFTSKISLISATEYVKYIDKIGIKDEIGKIEGTGNSGVWTTRTGDTQYGDNADKKYSSIICFPSAQVQAWNSPYNYDVRPVMYLDNNFFTEVELDLSAIGDNVKNVIRDNYTRTDLAGLYDAGELDILFGAGEETDAPTVSNVNVSGIFETAETIEVSYDCDALCDDSKTVVEWEVATANNGSYGEFAKVTEGKSVTVTNAMATTVDLNTGNKANERKIRAKVTPYTADGVAGEPVYSKEYVTEPALGPINRGFSVSERPAQAPAENIFELDDKNFILLDTYEKNGEKSYFIITKEAAVSRKIDKDANWGKPDVGDNNFDPEDRYPDYAMQDKHLAYWLNSDKEGGFLHDATEGTLSADMKKYIDMEHVWKTEACSNIKNDYKFTAGVTILSARELQKYSDKIGYKDTGANWWLRTGYGNEPSKNMYVKQDTMEIERNIGKYANDVRPVFYLKEAFFENVAVNVNTLGSKVRELLKTNYTRAELEKAGYTSQELDIIYDETPVIKPVIDSVTMEGTGETTTTMTASVVLGENAVSVNYQWQTSTDGTSFTDIKDATEDSLYITSAYASTGEETSVPANRNITRYLRVKAVPVAENGTLGEPVYSEALKMPKGLGPKTYNVEGIAATDKKYVFSLAENADGEGQKFILLNDEEDGSYFVMGFDIYSGNVPFDSNSDVKKRQRYDSSSKTNIGYYIENELWNGNIVGEKPVITLKLPQAIKDHSIKKVWKTERGTLHGNATSDYTFEAYVTIISATEWGQYKDIIGLDDNNGAGWWTRTAAGVYETDANYHSMILFRPTLSMKSGAAAAGGWAGAAIRPVMYLDNDFFKEVKLDVYTLGSEVKSVMKAAYSEQELAAAGYTPAELNIIYDRVDKPTITSVEIFGDNLFGGQKITSEVTYDEKTASVRYQWQESADGQSFGNIANATGEEFTITNQGGKYVRLAVTPVSADSISGDTVYSNALLIEPALSKMTQKIINDSGKVKATTDAADIFTVGSRRFIMLDSNDSGEFFVMTYDAYGRSVFDSNNTQKYDISDSNNIGYYVNNTVLNGTDPNYPFFNDIVKSHMVNKIWRTEPGTRVGDVSSEYSFESTISLISATEYMQYADKIGVVDEMAGAWATRTAGTYYDNGDKSYNNVICFASGKAAEWDNDTGSFFTRPVMYLDKGFFLEAKIPVTQLGANVINEMKNVYTAAELATVYTKEELNAYFGISDYEIKNASAEKENNTWKVTADVVSSSAEAKDALFIAAVYDETGETLKGVASSAVKIENGSVNMALTVDTANAGDTDVVKVMLWDSWKTIVPLCEQAVINN